MGEVYRAHDTRLNRDVAIKVLPHAFATDADRLARFTREAQVLAALNHQNIAAVYGLEELPSGGVAGSSAIVLELVEGTVLSDVIAARPLPIEQAVSIALQMTDALEAAHHLGIVHRDLKPSNIKIRPDGTVKVLDFGLAKALAPGDLLSPASHPGGAGGIDITPSPTVTSPVGLTVAGVILGTAAYMAPEQAKGRPADTRADIWAFGCVLYEMLTGRRAFASDDVTETLAFVMTREPVWEAVPSNAPAPLRRLLRRCLQKNPARRLRDIGDARLDLEETLQPSPADGAPPPPRRSGMVPWITSGVACALAVAVLIAWTPWRRVPAPAEIQFEFPAAGSAAFMAISPDGQHVVYSATPTGESTSMLWLRPLRSLESQRLLGTEGAIIADWSPDSRFIVFAANQRLLKMAIAGGPPQLLTDVGAGTTYQRAAWSGSGDIVFSSGGRLQRVSDRGGTAIDVSVPDTALSETFHATPWFLPDGRRFLYTAWSEAPDHRAVYASSLDSPAMKVRIMPAESKALFADPGVLLFLRSGTLMAQRFDADSLTFSGDPVPLVENVAYTESTGAAAFHISANGTLVYRRGGPPNAPPRELRWVNRSGNRGDVIGPPTGTPSIELSPDGTRATGSDAFGSAASSGTGDVWVLDLVRGVRTRLTTDPGSDQFPVWSSNGNDVIFYSNRGGRGALYAKPANGAAPERLVRPFAFTSRPRASSPDGRMLILEGLAVGSGLSRDLAVVHLDTSDREQPLIATPADETQPTISPNGRWMAYASNESGTYQVLVQPFPDIASGKWQISSTAGQYPRWSRDGRELYYIRSDRQLVAVAVKTDGAFERGAETPLFEVPFGVTAANSGSTPYDVAPNRRFLIGLPSAGAAAAPNAPIVVIVNWTARLDRN